MNGSGGVTSPGAKRVIHCMTMLFAALLLADPATAAEPTIYKTIGPDGRVVYSDRVPSDGHLQQTMAPSPRAPGEAASLTGQDAPLARAEPKVENVVPRNPRTPLTTSGTPVLFVNEGCTECRRAQLWLAAHQVDYRLVDVSSPEGRSDYVAAGGRGAPPLLLRRGRRVQGWSDSAYEELFGLR